MAQLVTPPTAPKPQRAPALQEFIELLDALVREPFPRPWPGFGYWDYKLPVYRSTVDGSRASHAFRQTCIEMLLLGCTILRSREPPELPFVRVVACIKLPGLYYSNLTVFFDESYHERFFTRDEPYQRWTPLPPDRSLLREWAIPDTLALPERGYHETLLLEEDLYEESEIWFYGDVGSTGDGLRPRTRLLGGDLVEDLREG